MPFVDGKYVMPSDPMFDAMPLQSGGDCADPLCDECVRGPKRRKVIKNSSGDAKGSAPAAAAPSKPSTNTAATPLAADRDPLDASAAPSDGTEPTASSVPDHGSTRQASAAVDELDVGVQGGGQGDVDSSSTVTSSNGV